ncbi:putative GTP binding protein [Talaromyces proteolyticus]|uniref:GTP binding protein n=1 Tax=Talaromyces proteolyticus TaxID=1131652 RepID=A0AAD4Q640_9EURO|nr:putative GTP binding protein [Talaromyces proteolyticus]KAH8705296.1 putative GTP binding protein [Talaromyces proteolyticus]
MEPNPSSENTPSLSLDSENHQAEASQQVHQNDQEMSESTDTIVHDPPHSAGFNPDDPTHPAAYANDFTSSQNYSPPEDEQQHSSRFSSPTMAYQPHPQQPVSRPSSGLSNRDRYGYTSQPDQNQKQPAQPSKNSVVIKVGMVGDAQIGKTSLMVKYVEGSWDEDYIQTLGVNFMEKTISIRNTEITFSIWDLGGQREFVNMLPLVCNDAVAILFMFDLTRKSTLNSIKEWYRQGRGFNKTAIPFLIGTKYDHFVNFPREDQEEISLQAKRYAKAMRASLIFSSTSHSINVQKIFKIVLSKAFDLKCTIPEIENVGEPLLLYKSV